MSENKGFDFQQFINDSREVLVNPKEYFMRMETTGGLGEPIIKALIYGAISGFFTMIWSLFKIGSAAGGFLAGGVGIAAFFFTIIGAVIGAFIGGLIVLILSSISSGNNEYEANMRVAVSLMVVMPISSFLNIFGGIHYWLNTIISLGVNLYAIYMLYFGLIHALKGKQQTAKVLGLVLGGIMVLFSLIFAVTRQATRTFMKEGGSRIERQMERYQDEAEKALEEAAKELEEKND